MKKYILRFGVAIIAFLIGISALYVTLWDQLVKFPTLVGIHSAENNSPFSLREGVTIRLKPYDAVFDIPRTWVEPRTEKNLFLTRAELNDVSRMNRFVKEEAQVLNSILPFEECAAHVGEKGWDSGVVSDQARVYVVDLSQDDIRKRVEQDGLDKAARVFDKASLSSGTFGEWQKSTLRFVHAPTHAILMRDIDFYYRSFGVKTVVFVFLHPGGMNENVDLVLSSFKWHSKL